MLLVTANSITTATTLSHGRNGFPSKMHVFTPINSTEALNFCLEPFYMVLVKQQRFRVEAASRYHSQPRMLHLLILANSANDFKIRRFPSEYVSMSIDLKQVRIYSARLVSTLKRRCLVGFDPTPLAEDE